MLDGGGIVSYNYSIAQILMSLDDEEAAAKWAEEDALANSAQAEGVVGLCLARHPTLKARDKFESEIVWICEMMSALTPCHVSICFIFLMLLVKIQLREPEDPEEEGPKRTVTKGQKEVMESWCGVADGNEARSTKQTSLVANGYSSHFFPTHSHNL